MKTPFKKVPAIDKCFRTRELRAQSVDATFDIKVMSEKGMQIPLLVGAGAKHCSHS